MRFFSCGDITRIMNTPANFGGNVSQKLAFQFVSVAKTNNLC